MASQSPKSNESPQESQDEYQLAWAAIRKLVLEEGQSWSGRELNCSYLNTGNGRFVNVSGITGAEFIDDARSVAMVDWDNDGDLDMVLKNRTAPRLRVMRNDYKAGGRFIAVDLRATEGHPDAIGAQVVVEAGGKKFMRRVYCGDGFLSQGPRRLHFGLGAVESIDRLTVNWTHGASESFVDVPLDSFLRITQGTGEVITQDVPKGPRFRKAESAFQEGLEKAVVRVPLVAKLPLGPLPLPSFQIPDRTTKDLLGRPMLINLWATWCNACRGELKEFHEREKDLRAAGLQIIPMTTEEEGAHAKGINILSAYNLDGAAGYADKKLMSAFQLLITEVTGASGSTPMPSSFLVDKTGRLAVLYLGPVSVDVLLKDLKRMERSSPTSHTTTEYLGGGRWVSVRGRKYRLLARGFRLLGFGDLEHHFLSLLRQR